MTSNPLYRRRGGGGGRRRRRWGRGGERREEEGDGECWNMSLREVGR